LVVPSAPTGASWVEDTFDGRSTYIDTFWARALVDDDFPVDFYAAGGG